MIRLLLTSVAVALAIVLPLWVVWRVTLYRRAAAAGGIMPLRREVLRFAMVAYSTAVVVLTILPLQTGLQPAEPNLIPFRSIVGCVVQTLNAPDDLLTHCTADFAGNIALLFPFGLLAPFFLSRPTSARRILVPATIISGVFEFIQLLERVIGGARSPDIDDVILNVVGAGAGYLIFNLLRHSREGGNPE